MGGFRKALPFTYGCFVIGGLALSGVPPFSGFFSKDEILATIGSRGGLWIALVVVGYIGALLTAVYTWRMIFRAFWGDPVPEARELERGHMHHAEQPFNPANGEIEDTGVGFPGPEHHIAENTGPMKGAMGILALLAIAGGFLQVPGISHALESFLEPTFADSALKLDPSNTLTVFGLVLGAALGLAGIAIAYVVWVRRPGTSARFQQRFGPVHNLFAHKWFFDEAINGGIVAPFRWGGRFAQQTFERVVVNGAFVGGASGVVRAGSAAARALQSGFLRAYAGLLIFGLLGVTLYFLLQSA
jgi:NADH-quinone oxidoreductase subunit L